MRSTNSRRSSSIARWFWEVGGTIRASAIVPSLVQLVAVVEHPARRLASRRSPIAGARLDLDRRRVGRLVGVDEPQGLVAGVEDLHRPHDDALERVAAAGAEAGLRGRLARERREPVES